jgi:diguanylate cyclase (GGDEF)-like protein
VPTFDVLLGTFGAGIYLIVAVIHADLWIRRRERLGHLWLAGASTSALIVDVTGIAIPFSPETAIPILVALNVFGVAGATASLVELVSELSRSPTAAWTRWLQIIVLGLAPFVPIAPPVAGIVLATCGILLITAIARALRAAREARHSRPVARAFVFLASCLLADLLKELTPIPIPDNLPILGFTVLFLSAARSLNDRFERDHDASRRDPLTGLHNRRSLLDGWEDAVHRARRSGKPVSVVLADIDHFKSINDTRGHAGGDAALLAVAQALRSALRAQDVVARWGGEEFMLLLPDTDIAGARRVAESARAAIESLRVEHAGAGFEVTLSLGAAEHQMDRTLDQTIADADAALYQAKEGGRNRVVTR